MLSHRSLEHNKAYRSRGDYSAKALARRGDAVGESVPVRCRRDGLWMALSGMCSFSQESQGAPKQNDARHYPFSGSQCRQFSLSLSLSLFIAAPSSWAGKSAQSTI